MLASGPERRRSFWNVAHSAPYVRSDFTNAWLGEPDYNRQQQYIQIEECFIWEWLQELFSTNQAPEARLLQLSSLLRLEQGPLRIKLCCWKQSGLQCR